MSTTIPPARKRAPMTFSLDPYASYGYAMAALAEVGPASSTTLAEFLAGRMTPHGGEVGGLGIGWYPMSVARLLTQIKLHGYPVARDPETGLWRLGVGRTREVRDAIAECYRLAAIDDRPLAASHSF